MLQDIKVLIMPLSQSFNKPKISHSNI